MKCGVNPSFPASKKSTSSKSRKSKNKEAVGRFLYTTFNWRWVQGLRVRVLQRSHEPRTTKLNTSSANGSGGGDTCNVTRSHITGATSTASACSQVRNWPRARKLTNLFETILVANFLGSLLLPSLGREQHTSPAGSGPRGPKPMTQ